MPGPYHFQVKLHTCILLHNGMYTNNEVKDHIFR